MDRYLYIAAVALIAFYVAARLRFELQMLQQNSYRPRRYLRWLGGDLRGGGVRVADIVTDCGLIAILAAFQNGRWGLYAVCGVGLICLFKALRLLKRRSKKPLVFTARALRLFAVSLALLVGVVVLAALSARPTLHLAPVVACLCAVVAPVILLAAWLLLAPVERAINNWYIRDARRILRAMPELIVIGITGSYGKTSTKHALYRILGERFSVVMTPGSFNTTLGVVRTVREHLKPYTQVFIVEMGAKNVGDIREICDIVKPSIGILTSVGPQHLESFGTIDNVGRAKFELIDALPVDGIAVLNDDFEYIRDRPVENVNSVFRYTSTEAAEAVGRGEFETRLVGRHNISNIYAGWLVGRALGMTPAEMRYATSRIEPVEHRLEVKRAGGLTIIDDAFNSNPEGAAMAMEVLSEFSGGGKSGRRIVVTPGMIELGARQAELNRELGRRMASACDFAIVVGEHNRDAIIAGLADGGFPDEQIYAARTFADVVAKVRSIARNGDTILYENDLPDTFK